MPAPSHSLDEKQCHAILGTPFIDCEIGPKQKSNKEGSSTKERVGRSFRKKYEVHLPKERKETWYYREVDEEQHNLY